MNNNLFPEHNPISAWARRQAKLSRRTYLILIWVIYFSFLNEKIVYANAGVPMIVLTFPYMLIALVPIILIESLILSQFFALPYKKIILPTFLANALSTILGFPLAWILLLIVELITTRGSQFGNSEIVTNIASVTLQAAWLIPYEDKLWWMIPIAAIVGLIPAYIISILSEAWIIKINLPSYPSGKIKNGVIKANLITYGLLTGGYLILLICQGLQNYK